MAEIEYIPLYTGSPAEAAQYGETELFEKSFKENVCCARAIEKAIRDSALNAEDIPSDCAKQVLEEYGFKRTGFILAHSIRSLGPLIKSSPEIEAWSWRFPYSRDGNNGRYYEADTALQSLEAFIRQYQAEYQTLGLLNKEQCVSAAWEESLVGRVLVLSPNSLRESCWNQQNQLWLAQGGFGTAPNARGRAVYATCLSDGEEARWNREDFTGVLDERYLPEWAKEKLEALRTSEQEQSVGQVMA